MKYFKVIAKCGHVGRNNYFRGEFFVGAENKKEAAQKVKTYPRVKKNHKDVILNVEEITNEQYIIGRNATKNNPYFKCKSKYEQNAIMELIQDQIFSETETQNKQREKSKFYKSKTNKTKGIRNPYKYAKYNKFYNEEYIGA